MIAVTRSGNNNLCHIVTPIMGGRPVPQQWFSSKCTGHRQPNRSGKRRRQPSDRQLNAKPVPILADLARRYFFSITHCRGCWCLRAKSITCVTLVSAIS
jgi:hypothetical protein